MTRTLLQVTVEEAADCRRRHERINGRRRESRKNFHPPPTLATFVTSTSNQLGKNSQPPKNHKETW